MKLGQWFKNHVAIKRNGADEWLQINHASKLFSTKGYKIEAWFRNVLTG